MCVSVVYVIYISYYFKMLVNDLFLIIKDENTTFNCLVNTFGNIFDNNEKVELYKCCNTNFNFKKGE